MHAVRPYRNQMPVIGVRAYVDPAAVIIGDVVLGEDASVWPRVVIRGDVHYIRVGARTNIQDGVIVHVTHDGVYTPAGFPTVIGDDVTIGHAAVIHACTIENACLIGMHATILDGVVIRKHGFVGAGSVIAPGKTVHERELWVGNPARKVRELSDQEVEKLYYSAQHYVRLKNDYLGTEQ